MRKLSDEDIRSELVWLEATIERLQGRKHELLNEQVLRAKRATKREA